MEIDIEKLLYSLIISDRNMYSKKTRSEWVENALKDQGLVYKDGKLVSINEQQ